MNTFAWQGWRLDLPADWNPVKLEGDYARGQALITDMSRPRLGIRWATPRGGSFDIDGWAMRALKDEVGKLAADAARSFPIDDDAWVGSKMYVDPDPPGRDVWVGRSAKSGRLIEVVNHDRTLAQMLPTLHDSGDNEARLWSVFDLRCTVPAEYPLVGQRLNAGDLSLSFACGRKTIIVRQLALAKLSLQRVPIEKWLAQQSGSSRHYKPADSQRELENGLMQSSRLRRRFAWMRWLPRVLVTLVMHDEPRDRLVFVQANDEALAREVAATVGR